jgi:excisionase family DNA binding protein
MITIPPKYQDRIGLSLYEAADILGIHRSTLYRRIMPHVYSGRIQSLKVGGRRLLLVTSFLDFVEQEVNDGA